VRRRWTAFWQVHAFPYYTQQPTAKGSPVGMSPAPRGHDAPSSVVSEQGPTPNLRPRSDVRTPPTRQRCAHDGGMRAHQAGPARRIRALAPPWRTDQAADRNGCDSARRTRPWALGHRYGRLQDRIGGCRALHTDPGTDAAQHLIGARPAGDFANAVTLATGWRVERPATELDSHRYPDRGVE
jgi:hypothetical protein